MSTNFNTIAVPIDEYSELLAAKSLLDSLRAAGVDNWEGYDFAVEMYMQNQLPPDIDPNEDVSSGY